MKKFILIWKLRKHYSKVIKRINDGEDPWGCLTETYTAFGICYCKSKVFKDYTYYKWISKYALDYYPFWGPKPCYLSSKKFILYCLQIRLNNLNKEQWKII